MERGLHAFLSSFPTITDAVENRIYPQKAPQQGRDFPQLTYSRVNTERDQTLDGRDNLSSARMEISAWALRQAEAADLAEDIRQIMDGFKGTWEAEEQDFTIDGVFLDDQRDNYHPPHNADDVGVYSVTLEFSVWFRE
jgi:hypothetical protein